MKLCLISPFPPARGGIAAFARRIHDSLRQAGADIEVIPLNGLLAPLRILPELLRIRPDVVRIEYSIAMYGPGLLLLNPVLWLSRRLIDARLAATYHEPVRDMALLGWLGRVYYRLISRLFDRIYVHTREARQALIEKAGVPAEKVLAIPFGTYDFPDRTDRSDELEATYQLGDREVVLFFGFIHIVKGIDDFIAAARLVLDRCDPAAPPLFVVAGAIRRRRGVMRIFEKPDEAYYRKLLALRRRLGLEDDVRFLGYVEEHLVYSLIERAKVVVVPYTTAEQSSLLNMAIPLGKPTVASDLGGHREMLDEVGGLVAVGQPEEYAAEIVRLLTDPDHYRRIVDAYREIEERENAGAVARLLLDDMRRLDRERD